ncbi:hypothetical protein ACI3PL_30810, partial [Lacticaseibacillus paracasei]
MHQTVKCPANALIRVSCWALTSGTDATLQLWDAALTGQYVAAQTTSATATRLEAYLTPAMRSNATSFAV